MKPLIILLIFLITSFSFQSKTSSEIASIKIGTQIWTTQNLDVTTFRNGDKIPEIESPTEFYQAGLKGKAAWCYYNGDAVNGKKYGRLYNWYAVHDSRGLAPQGWHLPTDKEWIILTDYLGGETVAGKKMKSVIGWDGDNSSGFNAVPEGSSDGGRCEGLGTNGEFWTATEYSSGLARSRGILTGSSQSFRGNDDEPFGFSVRCVKD